MPRFKVGDYVERVGSLIPEYMKVGSVLRVVPHHELPEGFSEYEIDFTFVIGMFYELQLKHAESPSPQSEEESSS